MKTIALDRHYFPVEIIGGDRLKIDSTEVSLTPGIYYTHDDSGDIDLSHPSLYRHITARLASVIGGSWAVDPVRPSGYALRSGVRLRKLSGASVSAIDMSETTPLVQRVLGFSGEETGLIPFVGNVLQGEISAYGSWCPWSMFEGRADSKDSYMSRVTKWSSDHPEVAFPVIWRERRVRLLTYSYVFGSYINQNRAKYDDLAAQAGISMGDKNNSLENLWMIHGRNLGDVLVVYDQTDLDLKIETNEYEIVKFASVNLAQSMDAIATRMQLGLDVWSIKLPYVILGGNYGL